MIGALRYFELKFKLDKTNIRKSDSRPQIKITGLENIKNKKVRIFKFDDDTKIRNFICRPVFTSQINVIQPDFYGNDRTYALLPDGSRINNIFFKSPFYYRKSLSHYLSEARLALVKDKLYIFGGASSNGV